MMTKKTSTKNNDVTSEFDKEIESKGLSEYFRRIDEIVDMNVECVSTDIPALDRILHNKLLGLPKGRDIEIYSREPEVGKTTLAMDIGVAWQKKGLRVAIIDVAGTITRDYMKEQGFIIDQDEANEAAVCIPYFMPPAVDEDGNPLAAEKIFDIIRNASKICDLVIVDDIPSLMQQSDMDKTADEGTRTGGIAKILTDHMRRTTVKRATMIWINQQRQKIGFSMPGMPAKYASMAGMAIPFFGSIRLDLRVSGKIEIGSDKTKECIGVRVEVKTAKNKVSPPYKSAIISYLDGEGFSSRFDYYQLAIKLGIVEKSGAWFSYKGERIGQGEMKAYAFLKESPEVMAKIKADVDNQLKLESNPGEVDNG